jgi:hypothetical protein
MKITNESEVVSIFIDDSKFLSAKRSEVKAIDSMVR